MFYPPRTEKTVPPNDLGMETSRRLLYPVSRTHHHDLTDGAGKGVQYCLLAFLSPSTIAFLDPSSWDYDTR